MGTMPNNKCCSKPTAAAVGRAAFCLEWTQAAAAWTANPVQNEQELLLGIVPILSVPISGVQRYGYFQDLSRGAPGTELRGAPGQRRGPPVTPEKAKTRQGQ
eukprot:8014952-Pyramimonas_sp.AAC.1